ncbi:MAG: hypothetical protein WC378_00905 [Opitutaceae bacterium]|jgi:hypothetical protein
MPSEIKLPDSPLVPAAAREALRVLNALRNIEIIVILPDVIIPGQQLRGTAEIKGDKAIITVK